MKTPLLVIAGVLLSGCVSLPYHRLVVSEERLKGSLKLWAMDERCEERVRAAAYVPKCLTCADPDGSMEELGAAVAEETDKALKAGREKFRRIIPNDFMQTPLKIEIGELK